jgi:hypothetical protein
MLPCLRHWTRYPIQFLWHEGFNRRSHLIPSGMPGIVASVIAGSSINLSAVSTTLGANLLRRSYKMLPCLRHWIRGSIQFLWHEEFNRISRLIPSGMPDIVAQRDSQFIRKLIGRVYMATKCYHAYGIGHAAPFNFCTRIGSITPTQFLVA